MNKIPFTFNGQEYYLDKDKSDADEVFLNSLPLPNSSAILKQLFDDLISGGECAYKTEIIDGKPAIQYVDPISDELQIAIYNAEHKDSQICKTSTTT